jgi:hypothetical protein
MMISMRASRLPAATFLTWLLLAAPAGAQTASEPPPHLDDLLACSEYQPKR